MPQDDARVMNLHRYAITQRYCAGRNVLDLACREGRGSALLARTANSVLGLDPREASIAQARRTYYRTNLKFETASGTNIPLADSCMDVIACFDTLEYFADQEGLLLELHRVLMPGGLLFISTANRAFDSEHPDPHHVSPLYFDEFRDLLTRHFLHVELYGQERAAASLLQPLGRSHKAESRWVGTDEPVAALREPVEFFAVCGYLALPDVASGFTDADSSDGTAPVDVLPSAIRPGGLNISDRVMIACAPKSGSTYVASVLARYFDAQIAGSQLREMQWEAEQNLNRALLDQLGGSYVLQMHMKPYPLNLALMKEFGISLLLQWRNLGDMIVSLDEHLPEFGTEQPLCYIHDGPGFVASPADRRYEYLIASCIEWYIWFYLAWRKENVAFGVYERMVADPPAFFTELIGGLGHEVSRKKLHTILSAPEGFTRYNVGTLGRSAGCFSEENKRQLEAIVLSNPWSEQLEILLWELPWDVPALERISEFDGTVVTPRGTETFYFVSRGVRHRLIEPDSWLASRISLRKDAVKSISRLELDLLTEGSPLS